MFFNINARLLKKHYQLSLFVVFCLTFFSMNAQDIHFSQFYNSPMNLNPALTGVFKGDQRIVGNYRNQWASVPVPYLTFSGAYDQKIFLKALGDGFFGGGLIFNYDKSGDGEMIWSQLGANVSYTQPLSEQLFISGGFQYLLGSRRVNPDKLTWAEQWNGDIFDQNASLTEDFNNNTRGFSSLSAGLNLHFQLDGTRTKADVGVGAFHLNKPSVNFFEDKAVSLPIKGNSYTIGTIEVHPKMDMRVFGFYSFQTKYRETVVGAALRYHLSLQRSREISVQIGTNMRLGDALIPTIEVQYHALRVGLSYDMNTSAFEVATRKKGGPEISVEYIITKVKSTKTFKSCPIF